MGEIIAGDRLDQYELKELLARSGMASIFKAIDHRSGSTVALKVPHMQFESDVAFYERFRREELIGQKLEHPNIVRVLAPEQKSRLYLVMEFAEGRSLRAVIKGGRLPLGQALDITRQICRALVYMHSRGIVHRDLKPDNVLLGDDGQVKLLDFGIAMDEAARRLTWFGLSPPIGTPDYMAPEQIRGKRGDARTDVYALGTMLYEMVTGELPYAFGNMHALMRAKLNEDPRPPREVMSDIDRSIEEIILRSIDRSPRERYASAKEMLDDLEDPSHVVPRDRSSRHSAPWLERVQLPRRILVPGVLVLIIAALLVLTVMSGRPASHRNVPLHGSGHGSSEGR
ncbi:MAG: serine/threonine-protein kinase [Polyangiaceae bacterium]|jgi:serine/threonine-protein kinase